MNRMLLKSAVAATALFAFAGVAAADVVAVATTDLNIRSGPGPHYPVVGAIGANQEAVIGGCQEGSNGASSPPMASTAGPIPTT